jgi:hypothetical protein
VDTELLEEEALRLRQICAAAAANDWEAFSALSDRPFSNSASMLEQFLESSEKLRAWDGNWTMSTHVGIEPDGARIVFAEMKSPGDNRPVKATLCTRLYGGVAKIEIWTFYCDLDWDAFLAGSSV